MFLNKKKPCHRIDLGDLAERTLWFEYTQTRMTFNTVVVVTDDHRGMA